MYMKKRTKKIVRDNLLFGSGLVFISLGLRQLNAPTEVSTGVPTIIGGAVLVYEGVRK
tara:strand:+ start:58 stop:231 length:174 start_codon:yes stop_codon:yes gene_type:complete